MTEPAPGYRMVVIGTSAGGLHALRIILAALPGDFHIPMAVVQHRSRESELLCELLQEVTPLAVIEATDKEAILPGCVYVAPSDYHLLIEDGYLALSVDEPVRYSRPSIDVMFESAADSFGMDCIGVVLTGANADGAEGLRRIARAGGYALVQDPAAAEVSVMPRAAIAALPEARVLPLEEIGPHLAGIRSRAIPRPEHRT